MGSIGLIVSPGGDMKIVITPLELGLLIEGLDRLKDETVEFGVKMAESPEEKVESLELVADIETLEVKLIEKKEELDEGTRLKQQPS